MKSAAFRPEMSAELYFEVLKWVDCDKINVRLPWETLYLSPGVDVLSRQASIFLDHNNVCRASDCYFKPR